MDKEKCLKILKDLKAYSDYEDKLSEVGINITWEQEELNLIRCHLIDYLGNELGSVEDLEYFIYDLEFGSKYTKDSVADLNGNSIDWSSIEKFVGWCEKKRSKN